MAENEEELKNLLMKVKKMKSWFKSQHLKPKIMACGPITSWQIDGETIVCKEIKPVNPKGNQP